jgi:hypothetical protein
VKQIEPKQTQLLHIAKSQCKLSDVEYRDLLAGHSKDKKTSSKDLTYSEADAVLNYFVKTLGFKIRTRGCNPLFLKDCNPLFSRPARARGPLPGNVTALPSPDQLKLIDALGAQVAWKYADGFQRWLAKYVKTDKIRTSAQASRCIEGLKGMLKNSKE